MLTRLKKIPLVLVLLTISSLLFCSCANERYATSDFFAMNTYASIVAQGASNDTMMAVKQLILGKEKLLSAHFDGSVINNLDTPQQFSENDYNEVISLLRYADSIAKETNGAFDYTLGGIISLWSITGEHPYVPTQAEIKAALSSCGFDKVSFDENGITLKDAALRLDLGAIAKGYVGDLAASLLSTHGLKNYAISIGGNVTARGASATNARQRKEGWLVGLKSPYNTDELLGNILLVDSTVSVSGSYERFFEQDGKKYHHIIDPKKGIPSDSGLCSVAVISQDATLADALSTALFVMGLEKGADFYSTTDYDFEAIFCTNDGIVYITQGLADNFIPNSAATSDSEKKLVFETEAIKK